jgi:TRAP transporter TAXI family solute receptor
VATLYFQYFHMVALTSAGVATVGDVKGKALTTQQKGNTGEQMTRDVLKVYGLDYGKLAKVNHGSYNDSVDQLKDGHAQVFGLITTVPASAVMDLAAARDVRVLEVPDDAEGAAADQRRLRQADRQGQHPRKRDKDIQTIGTWTHLITSCSCRGPDLQGARRCREHPHSAPSSRRRRRSA